MPNTFVPVAAVAGSGLPFCVPPSPAGLPKAHSPSSDQGGWVSSEKHCAGTERRKDTGRVSVAVVTEFEKTTAAELSPIGNAFASGVRQTVAVLDIPGAMLPLAGLTLTHASVARAVQ